MPRWVVAGHARSVRCACWKHVPSQHWSKNEKPEGRREEERKMGAVKRSAPRAHRDTRARGPRVSRVRNFLFGLELL